MGRRRGEGGSVAVVETTSTAPFVPEGARYLSLSGLRGERGQDSGINNLSGAERGGSRDRLDVSERRTARVILSRPLPPIPFHPRTLFSRRANRLLTRPGILSTPKIATENRLQEKRRERNERVVKAVEVEKRSGVGAARGRNTTRRSSR